MTNIHGTRLGAIAQALAAIANCKASGNHEWQERHGARIDRIMQSAPSGSGFDNGTSLDDGTSTAERIRFNTSFHHMSEHGYYDGWTEHVVTVRASLVHGFTVDVSGRNRNDIKDHIAETFYAWLAEPTTLDELID